MELCSIILDEPRSILREDVIFFFKRTLARICYILFMTNHDTRELAAQLVASWFWKTRVAGSNLFYPTSIIFINHLIFSKGQKEKKNGQNNKNKLAAQLAHVEHTNWMLGVRTLPAHFFIFVNYLISFQKEKKRTK